MGLTVTMVFLGCHVLNFFSVDGDSNITYILADFIIVYCGCDDFLLLFVQLFKIAVSNCERHKTCESCRSAKDPYCGWCSLQRKRVSHFSFYPVDLFY